MTNLTTKLNKLVLDDSPSEKLINACAEIDIESCFEPIFEPLLETLEEWRRWEDEPEPTLENTSVYVTEPDGIQYFYCGNTRIRVSEHFSQSGKPMDKLIENVVQYAARNAG